MMKDQHNPKGCICRYAHGSDPLCPFKPSAYRDDLIRKLWEAQLEDCPEPAKRLMAEAAQELERCESGAPRGEAVDRAGPQVSPLSSNLVSLSFSDIVNMTLTGDESFYKCEPVDAEIERLTESVESWRRHQTSAANEWHKCMVERDRLRAGMARLLETDHLEIEGYRIVRELLADIPAVETPGSRDALRYLWLRSWFAQGRPRSEIDPFGHIAVRSSEDIDVLIDRAMEQRSNDGSSEETSDDPHGVVGERAKSVFVEWVESRMPTFGFGPTTAEKLERIEKLAGKIAVKADAHTASCPACIATEGSTPIPGYEDIHEKTEAKPNDAFRWICIHCTTVNGLDEQNCLGCRKPRYPHKATQKASERKTIGFGIPNLMQDVRDLMVRGVPSDTAIEIVANRCELRSEAIIALRDALNRGNETR